MWGVMSMVATVMLGVGYEAACEGALQAADEMAEARTLIEDPWDVEGALIAGDRLWVSGDQYNRLVWGCAQRVDGR